MMSLIIVEFLAEPRYDTIVIQAPNNIDTQYRCTITVGGDMYSGYGDNGSQAFIAAVRRLRDTDPDMPGSQTMTINTNRGVHRREDIDPDHIQL